MGYEFLRILSIKPDADVKQEYRGFNKTASNVLSRHTAFFYINIALCDWKEKIWPRQQMLQGIVKEDVRVCAGEVA